MLKVFKINTKWEGDIQADTTPLLTVALPLFVLPKKIQILKWECD
jgi:hypothetical protein